VTTPNEANELARDAESGLPVIVDELLQTAQLFAGRTLRMLAETHAKAKELEAVGDISPAVVQQLRLHKIMAASLWCAIRTIPITARLREAVHADAVLAQLDDVDDGSVTEAEIAELEHDVPLDLGPFGRFRRVLVGPVVVGIVDARKVTITPHDDNMIDLRVGTSERRFREVVVDGAVFVSQKISAAVPLEVEKLPPIESVGNGTLLKLLPNGRTYIARNGAWLLCPNGDKV